MGQGAEFPVRAVLDDKAIEQLIVHLTKAGKEAGKTDKEIAEMNSTLRKTGTDGVKQVSNVNKGFDNLNKTVLNVGKTLVAAIAVDQLVRLGKEIVDITAQFQRMEAVLTNTLGSRSQARLAMADIARFAARTPFAVNELTESYVKLANQGFIPTMEELRKLGDLSSSVGKQFNQLTEAIIDAQTGEFERLKEFGIRASKEGDRVTFTFKGLKTQTDFTNKAIREYILGLGDAVGVSGSMAAISKTVGGEISNLGDTYETLLKVIGDGNKGPMSEGIQLLNEFLNGLILLVETSDQMRDRAKLGLIGERMDQFKQSIKVVGDLNEATEKFISNLVREREQIIENQNNSTDPKQYQLEVDAINDTIDAIEEYVFSLKEKQAVEEKAAKSDAKQLGIIGMLNEKLDDLNKRKKESLSRDEILLLNNEIRKTREELEKLENLGAVGKDMKFRNPLDDFSKEMQKRLATDTEKALKRGEQAMEDFTEKYAEEEAKREAIARQAAQNKVDFQQFVQDAFINFSNELFELEQAKLASQAEAIEMQREYELELAGDNIEGQRQINKKFDQEQRTIKTRQATADKNQALFNIFINGLQGAIAALASVPPNVPLAAAIGIAAGVNFGLVASKPIPKFAKGVYDLQGPGSTTSDSILARLSRKESVVDANTSQKFGWLLKPMIEDDLSLMDLKQLVDRHVPTRLRGDIMRPAVASDSAMLLELREVRKVIANKKETYIDIDENGFNKWTRQGHSWTEHLGKRYGS